MNSQKIISNHICKTLSSFTDENGQYIGKVDLDLMIIIIEGKFIDLRINHSWRKDCITDYTYNYLNSLKRKWFVEAYTAWKNAVEKAEKEAFERDRIKVIEWEIETIQDNYGIKEYKPRRSFFKKLVKPLYYAGSVFLSIMGVC